MVVGGGGGVGVGDRADCRQGLIWASHPSLFWAVLKGLITPGHPSPPPGRRQWRLQPAGRPIPFVLSLPGALFAVQLSGKSNRRRHLAGTKKAPWKGPGT